MLLLHALMHWWSGSSFMGSNMSFLEESTPNNASSSVVPKYGSGAVASGLEIFPPELYFGALVVGEDQLTRSFTATNIGRKTMRIESVELQATPQFTMTGEFPTLLRAGESFSMSLTYLSNMPGLFSGLVRIVTSEREQPYLIGLSGRVMGSLFIEETFANFTALVDAEAWARANADEAEAGQRVLLQATLGNEIEASVEQERIARVTAYEAIATDVTNLVARIGAAESSITTNDTVRASEDESLAERITQVEAGAGVDSVARAAITSEATARADADSAQTVAREALSAALQLDATTKVNAAVLVESQARVTADTANATALTNVQTTLNNSIGAVNTKADSSINRLGLVESNWTTRVIARSDGKQVIAGIKATATAGNGVYQSEILFQADNFKWVGSDINGTPQTLMTLGTVNGVSTPVLSTGVIGDNAVSARMVVNGSITADKVAANAVTADKIYVNSLAAINSKLGLLTSAQINIVNGDGANADPWGYLRSNGKWWGDSNQGWILARSGTDGGTFMDFYAASNMRLRMSSWGDCELRFPGLTLNQYGMTIDQLNVVDTLNVAGNAITVPAYAEANGAAIASMTLSLPGTVVVSATMNTVANDLADEYGTYYYNLYIKCSNGAKSNSLQMTQTTAQHNRLPVTLVGAFTLPAGSFTFFPEVENPWGAPLGLAISRSTIWALGAKR